MFLYFSDGAVRGGAELAGAPALPALAGRDGFDEYVERFPSVRHHNSPDCQRQMWEVRLSRGHPLPAACPARSAHPSAAEPSAQVTKCCVVLQTMMPHSYPKKARA